MTGGRQPAGLRHAVDIVHAVCEVAGAPSLIDDIQADLAEAGVLKAIDRHDTPVVFDWLAAALSFQGIADAVAAGYMAQHGQATWADIQRGLDAGPSCPKLQRYWHFHGCRYRKSSGTCAEPDHIAGCPLPRQNLRNGHLNQAAFSLFLFIRDIADGDLIGWLDHRLAEADDPTASDRLARLRQAVLEPLRNVYGVSNKVLSMTLSSLLLRAGRGPRWLAVRQHDRRGHLGAQFAGSDRDPAPAARHSPLWAKLLRRAVPTSSSRSPVGSMLASSIRNFPQLSHGSFSTPSGFTALDRRQLHAAVPRPP